MEGERGRGEGECGMEREGEGKVLFILFLRNFIFLIRDMFESYVGEILKKKIKILVV